jgi:hypothetical protein
MIPIKIAGKPYKIKAIAELTTKEFCELSKIEAVDIIKYISWQTGLSMQDCFFAVSDKRIEIAIGKVPDITKIPRSKSFDYSLTIDSVGQRHQVENSNLTGMELLVYCLAVSQARSNNSDEVAMLYDDYLARPFGLILPAGFFFYKSYKFGKRKGVIFLKSLLLSIVTWMRKIWLVLKSLTHIATT